jgi:hypothetical protein
LSGSKLNAELEQYVFGNEKAEGLAAAPEWSDYRMLTAQLWHALKSAHEGKSTEGPASGGFGKVERRLTPTSSISPA